MKTGYSKAGIAANIVVALVVLQSAVQILLATEERKRVFAKAAMPMAMPGFAICDIALLVLFLLPATRKTSFLLGICYYSAAVATRLVIKENPAEPMLITALLFGAMFVTNREVFTRKNN